MNRRAADVPDENAELVASVKAAQRKKEPLTTMTLRLPISMRNELVAVSSEYDIDLSKLVRELINDGLRRLPRSIP